jgi:dTDP-4-dehydrorhamnose 3,5-epimerase
MFISFINILVSFTRMIDGVEVKKLAVHKDERGRLMEILRKDDKIFRKFGQVYMTTVNPGFVKAWHYHKIQDDYFCCVKGKIRLGLYDSREGSGTKGEVLELFLGMENPLLVQIPKGVYHGFENAGEEEAIVINAPTECYNGKSPDEYRLDPFANDIPFKWNARKGG